MSINNKPKCAICETRLDLKKKSHYMSVFKTGLIDILNKYKSNSSIVSDLDHLSARNALCELSVLISNKLSFLRSRLELLYNL